MTRLMNLPDFSGGEVDQIDAFALQVFGMYSRSELHTYVATWQQDSKYDLNMSSFRNSTVFGRSLSSFVETCTSSTSLIMFTSFSSIYHGFRSFFVYVDL